MFFNPKWVEPHDNRMHVPVESWYNAITTRHSRRKYTNEKLPEDFLKRLEEISNEFHMIPGARSVVLHEPSNDLFTGVVGSYGAIRDAPLCMVVIGDLTATHVQEAAGYHGEGLVLEAAAEGIDSCWVGGMFERDVLNKRITIASQEKVLSVIALGYAMENKGKVERMMSSLIGSHRRKEVYDLLTLGSEEPDGWILKALEAARLAPSAVNRQPWRFKISENSVAIFVKNGVSKAISPRLDCGIAMLHLELGALKAGVQGSWRLSTSEPYVKYVVS